MEGERRRAGQLEGGEGTARLEERRRADELEGETKGERDGCRRGSGRRSSDCQGS